MGIILSISFLLLVSYIKFEPSVDELEDKYLIWYRSGRYGGRDFITIRKWK